MSQRDPALPLSSKRGLALEPSVQRRPADLRDAGDVALGNAGAHGLTHEFAERSSLPLGSLDVFATSGGVDGDLLAEAIGVGHDTIVNPLTNGRKGSKVVYMNGTLIKTPARDLRIGDRWAQRQLGGKRGERFPGPRIVAITPTGKTLRIDFEPGLHTHETRAYPDTIIEVFR